MAARHDIIHIDFQANAGKANAALQALQTESKKARDEVDRLRKELQNARNTNMPVDQIQKLETELKNAERVSKQWQGALQNNMKGVRALDEAIKQFNRGKGSVEGMSAALSKAARNAAQLAQSRVKVGSQEWKEMDALIVALDENILKANNDLKALVQTIKSGGGVSQATLSQAKRDLEQLLTLEVRGSKEWKVYDRQLKVVTAELGRLAEVEKKAAQASQITAMNKQMKNLKTLSAAALGDTRRFWEAMVAGAEQGSAELTRYEAKLKQVQNEEKRRKAASAETILKDTSKYGVDQVRLATQQMTQLRDAMQSGSAMWMHYNKLVQQGEAYLKEYADVEKIARGEAISLADALKVSANAGGKGFTGTDKQLKQAEAALQKALETAKKGTAEWQKYKDALDKVRVEMNNTGMTSERMRQIIDKPANAKNLNELSAAVKRAKAELDLMAGTIGKNSKEYEMLAQSTKKAEIQLKQLQGQAKGTASSFDKAWSRLKTYIGLYMGAAVAMQKLASTMGDILELSDKMGEVRKTTGFTADEVGRLSNNLKKMDVRTPLVNLMEISAAAGQLGLKTLEDVQGFTEAANKLMIALPEMGKEAATEMMRVAIATGEVEKIRKQLQEGTIQGSSATAVAMEKIASTIDRLRATSASTAPEITDFVKRVGAVGAQSGITIDQVSALGSTISSLGMRIEMSATALSRMIPAIRNNAFDIARAIGVTPNTIRDLFDAGKGMEVILMILQHMKDANMDEESIEAMMGMGGMRDIMKDLNQQGARAGIVFAGLSQNVDELRRQLGVASQAYKENIAIEQEFQKMNATTAAKWERLKNQIEEGFVGDQSQRFFGRIIDGLRSIADLVSSDGVIAKGLKTLLVMWAAIRIGLGQAILVKLPNALAALTASTGRFFTVAITGLKALAWQMGIHNRVVAQGAIEWKKLDVAMKQNVFGAITAAVIYAAYKLWDFYEATKETAAEIGAFNQKLSDEKKALDSLFTPLKNSNLAQDERSRLISEINSKYSKYLGYMLSETNSAIQLANAHELIAKRIREEAYEKRILEQENAVRSEHNKDINEAYGNLETRVRGGAKTNTDIQAVTDRLKSFADQNVNTEWRTFMKEAYNMTNRLVADGEIAGKEANSIRVALSDYAKQARSQAKDIAVSTASTRADLRNTQRAIQGDVNANLNNLIGILKNFGQNAVPASIAATAAPSEQGFLGKGWNNRTAGKVSLNWQGNANAQASTEMPLPGWKPQINEKNVEQVKAFVNAQEQLRGYIEANAKNISQQAKATAEAYLVSEDEMKRLRGLLPAEVKGGTGGGNGGWGEKLGAESTNYADMNAEQLVTRRKQMKDFVNAIQTDSDIKSVLAEDKALQKAIEGGMASDMRTVIEWYNTERLKIQDELHARHLTNTGDWMDPAKQKARHKQFKAELQAYLEELDAYYTERNQKIQDERNNEDITEGEAWVRTIKNEAEWHQRRAELQKMYSDKNVEVVKDEQEAIHKIIAARTGDDVKFIEKSIEKTKQFAQMVRKADPNGRGEAEYRKWEADLGLGWERDYLKQEKSIGKQVKFMADTLAKERPLNSIVEDLELTLSKMGILEGDVPKKTAFLLDQLEDAYTLGVKELVDRVSKAGFDEWAKQIDGDISVQQALIAQLRKAYEAVQDAIRKEASRIKKDADMMWKLIFTPDGKNLKKETDIALARMGLQQESIGRANQLIGAGSASENIASKLAIKQLQLQLSIQRAQFALMRKIGNEKAEYLDKLAEQYRLEGKVRDAQRASTDAENVRKSLNLAITEEEKKQLDLTNQIAREQEEIQNRLYQDLRAWSELLSSSLQQVFEASHAGDAEYYNELAKLNLTGKGGPGAGTYIVIDNAGTSKATAHYEHLDEREALEREHEIERQNAQAEAWKKLWDDLNNKMSERITDWINASLQNQGVDENTRALDLNKIAEDLNTSAVKANTERIGTLTNKLAEGIKIQKDDTGTGVGNEFASDKLANYGSEPQVEGVPSGVGFSADKGANYPSGGQQNDEATRANTEAVNALTQTLGGQVPEGADTGSDFAASKSADYGSGPAGDNMESGSTGNFALDKLAYYQQVGEAAGQAAQAEIDASNQVKSVVISNSNAQTQTKTENAKKETNASKQADKEEKSSAQSKYAAMASAMNMYGIAYQTMSNENMDTTQKFLSFALQAAGQTAIGMLTTNMLATDAQGKVELPGILGKAASQLGPIAGPIAFAAMTALLGGLMAVAMSKVGKAKSQIAQVTGASVGAGRLATGMLTYAEGNVNEFTDPSTLTPGRHYNVDGADGKTYRAKYMGKNIRTHITTGPEFHLTGEKGREAIIDAHTTRMMQMDDTGIWQSIQTLYNGGSMALRRRRSMKRGIPAFADGNLDEFEDVTEMTGTSSADMTQVVGLKDSLDRQNALLEELLVNGVKGHFDVYGRGGLVDAYDTGKKTLNRHGEKH